MDAIPKTQHRPISIKLNAAIRPRNVPFQRRYNLKKAKWQSYAKEVVNGIGNTNPVPENYEKFVNLVRRSSNKNIPRGCRTSYVCGLNDQSKDMYEDYQRRFAEDPFNKDTVRVGDALLDEISEAHRSKWKEMIESTDFTHSSRKAWKTINKLTKDYTAKVIAILKPGKDSTLPKSYRPISLLCHTYKLFERMILNRLNPLVKTMIIDQQAGFRPGKSTTGQLLNLT